AHDSGRGGDVKGGVKGGGTDDHGHRGEGDAADGAGRRRNGGAR
ncbi:single-stranded DNA-binding protein, partial [Burkholderia pseudomallei]|nr:single-stranded DNA-binding protein [Burkholderia pseudomallei]